MRGRPPRGEWGRPSQGRPLDFSCNIKLLVHHRSLNNEAARRFAAAIAAATGLAAPANADQYDFISALDNRGVTYANIIGMVDIGKGIRHVIRSGGALPAVNSFLAGQGWYSLTERGIIVVYAANNLCPDIWPTLNAQVQPQQPAPVPVADEY